MRAITHIIVHHSAGSGGTVDEIRLMHMRDRGWSDIGYHALITNGKDLGGAPSDIACDGMAFQGRPESRAGAHCSNAYGRHNAYTLGVCMTGNYMVSQPSKAQLLRLSRVIADWCGRYGIPCDREHVKGHREMSGHESNDCPGDNLLATLDAVVNTARKRLSAVQV